MKNKLNFWVVACVFCGVLCHSQDYSRIRGRGFNATQPATPDELINFTDYYLDDIDETRARRDAIFKYNNNMLNILFASEVSKYFNGSEDLSTRKFYANLDADEESVSFGANFKYPNKKKLEKLCLIWSVGFKAKAADKFATFVKNGKLDNSELGLTAKATFIGDGTITFTRRDANKMTPHRASLELKYTKKAIAYVRDEYPTIDKDSLQDLYSTSSPEYAQKAGELIADKYESLYEQFAKEEIAYMKDNSLYRSFRDYWFTIDAFIPIGEKQYVYANTVSATNKTANFYPIKVAVSGTAMKRWSDGQSLYKIIEVSAFNNNNIVTDSPDQFTLNELTAFSTTQQAITTTTQVYKTDFDRFVTTKIKGELIYFPLNWVGISPGIEQNIGPLYHVTNWKIGIPFSLKDSDGKQQVNFELQYKKFNHDDLIGMSLTYLFGKLSD